MSPEEAEASFDLARRMTMLLDKSPTVSAGVRSMLIALVCTLAQTHDEEGVPSAVKLLEECEPAALERLRILLGPRRLRAVSSVNLQESYKLAERCLSFTGGTNEARLAAALLEARAKLEGHR